jgi:hypothetical protein
MPSCEDEVLLNISVSMDSTFSKVIGLNSSPGMLSLSMCGRYDLKSLVAGGS